MGCLCNKNDNNAVAPLAPKDLPNLATYSSIDRIKLTKTFSEQVDRIKSFDKTYENFLSSAKSASAEFHNSLDSMNFYYSKKDFEEIEKIPEDLICPVCLITYGPEDYTPLELPCGHMLCVQCCKLQFESTKIVKCSFECPATQENPETFIVNQEALHKVQWISEGLYCYFHNLQTTEFCSTCRKLICEDCKSEHPRHVTTLLTSPSISKELSISKSNLDSYIKSLESTLTDLSTIQSTFKDLQIKLRAALAESIIKIESNKSSLLKNLDSSSTQHISRLNNSIQQICETMPIRNLDLYHDSLISEQEKSKIVQEEVKNEKNQILHMTQADFKNTSKINDPDFKPWEKVLSQISLMEDTRFLLLALTSLNINSVN